MHLLTGRWQLSATRLALLLALFFTLLNYGFFRTIWQAWRSAGGDGTFLWSVPLFIFLCLNIIFHLLLLPYLHKLIIPLILLLSAAVSYSVIFLGVYFDRAMLTNVLITTPAESAKLLTVPYALWLLALGVVPALLYLRVRVVYRRWWRELALRLGAVLVSLALALLLSHHYYQEYAAYGRNNHDLPHLIVPTNFIVASISKIKHQRRANRPYETVAADAHQQKTDPQRRVSVFIIGEATRAQNWGLNGYARQTTPQLAARGAEIINYPQVSSCGTYTAYSVPCMLSEQPRTRFDVDIASRRDNLLDILQRAGVRVVWYDNDTGCKGACANIEYHDMTALNLPAYCTDGECLDDILLQDIEQPLAGAQDTVIILHTIGSHGPTYYQRYTPEYRAYAPTCDTKQIQQCSREAITNTYDNTIRYVDGFIERVIARLAREKDWKSSVFYVSDHGESLGENGIYLHSTPYSVAPAEQTRVPMMLWLSDAWRQDGAVDGNCLHQRASSGEYSQDNVFHTYLGLFDVQTGGSIYQKELDLLAGCRK